MSSCFFFLFIWFVRWRQDICKTITLTYSDPSEVHWLSDQLVVLGNLLLRGKLNKAFADLSAQPARTTQQVTSSRNSCTKKKCLRMLSYWAQRDSECLSAWIWQTGEYIQYRVKVESWHMPFKVPLSQKYRQKQERRQEWSDVNQELLWKYTCTHRGSGGSSAEGCETSKSFHVV